jgi:predicted Zn-ribbon and HTH transcriptional regulator
MSEGTDMTISQANSIASLPADVMLMKMENESIMTVARAVPRVPAKIIGQLKELLEAYPAAAGNAIYRKPVGKVSEVTCGNPKCGIRYQVNKVDENTQCPSCESQARKSVAKVQKFAEGLGIRAAEAIRSVYGYTRLATTTEIMEDGKAKLTGVLVDYAAGNVTSDQRLLSPYYKSYSGKMEKTPEDRFLNVVVKAEKSKLKRDVILDNTPNIIKAAYREMCEEKLGELVSPELIEQKIVPAFAEYGISPEQLDTIIGKPRAMGWDQQCRLDCRKILTALKSGETTARDLLDDDSRGNGRRQRETVDVDDLLGGSEGQKSSEPTPPDPSVADKSAAQRIEYENTLGTIDTAPGCDAWMRQAEADFSMTDDDRAEVVKQCRAKAAVLRSKRGPRSNGGQKDLLAGDNQ